MGLLMNTYYRGVGNTKHRQLTVKQQAQLLQGLQDLLGQGFSFQESLKFLVMIDKKLRPYQKLIYDGLRSGQSISMLLKRLGCSDRVVLACYFAEYHGHLVATLKRLVHDQKQMQMRKEMLKKVTLYPSILGGTFLIFFILFYQYLLPSLMDSYLEHPSIYLTVLNALPTLFFMLSLFIVFVVIVIRCYMKKQSALKRVLLKTHLPYIGKLYQYYYTIILSEEWGMLLSYGVSFDYIQQIMRDGVSPWLAELGEEMHKALRQGVSWQQQLHQTTIFLPELFMILKKGDKHGQLGKELTIYSRVLSQRYLTILDQLLQWIQPICFLIIGSLIILMYLAIFMPLYGGIEQWNVVM